MPGSVTIIDNFAMGPFSLSAAGVLFVCDTTNYGKLAVQFINAATGSTYVFETSMDQINWVPAPFRTYGATGVPADGVSLTSANAVISGIALCNTTLQWLRVRTSVYGSGTATVSANLRFNAITTP